MSAPTNTKTPNPSNPSALKPRYSICKLDSSHVDQAAAIVCHSNCFHSSVWPFIYPNNMAARLQATMAAVKYLIQHQIDSGMSYGVFDDEYEYKTAEAKEVGGKLYWDSNEPVLENLKDEGERLLKQMDFPLVSVAMSYDAHVPLDMDKMKGMMEALPHFGLIYNILGEGDKRDPKSWQATGPKQVLMRNATSTRHDYEGEKIMSGLARWLMREAESIGYRGVQIECLADAVTHVWSEPPAPFKGEVVSEFHTTTWRDAEGKLAFEPSKQRVTKCFVELKPNA